MTKNLKASGLLVLFLLLCAGTPLLAQEPDVPENRTTLYIWTIIIGGAVIAIASAAGAYCQSRAIGSACEGISRNPGGAPHIRFIALLGLVLIETLVIYALLIAIMIIAINWGNYT
jgi:F-type H+-transporting ATPase subunit c